MAESPTEGPLTTSIRTLDQHIHAGVERVPPIDDLVRWLIQDGRRTIGLLDHSFLFDYDAERLAAWQAKNGIPAHYPPGEAGQRAFYAEVARLKQIDWGEDVRILQGLEVYEMHIPSEGLWALPAWMLDPLDYVAFEFKIQACTPNEDPKALGERLIWVSEQVARLHQETGISGFLCHPFRATLGPLEREGRADDPSLSGRGVYPEESVDMWLSRLDPSCTLVEINFRELKGYMLNPLFHEMVAATVAQLKAGGARFSFGSDLHPAYGFELPTGPDPAYQPEQLIEALGLSEADFFRFRGRGAAALALKAT